jgi:Leucine-rich repeat (LRR) protein
MGGGLRVLLFLVLLAARLSAAEDPTMALRKMGGYVGTNSQGTVIKVNLNGLPAITSKTLKQVARFPDLTDLSLEGTPVDDGALEQLGKLARLEWLNLYRTKITDRSTAILSGLTSLKMLPIGSTEISNSGLTNLARLYQLEYLGLRDTQITDTGLACLNALTNLTGLHLGETKVTDQGSIKFPACPNWRSSGFTTPQSRTMEFRN